MTLKTKGIKFQAKVESTFGTAPTFTNSDTICVEKAEINTKIDTVDRKCVSDTTVKQAGIPIRFTTDGSVSLEMDVATGANEFTGSILYEAGLGNKLTGGAEVDVANKQIVVHGDGSADHTLYSVSDSTKSIAVRKFFDSGDVVLQSLGCVINKVGLDFAQANILTSDFGIEGATFQTMSGLTKPDCGGCNAIPFVGKNATFDFYGATVNAKNVKIDISNTVTNEESITTDGYTGKVIVEKEIKGSFVCLLENFDYLDKLKNQVVGSLFLVVPNTSTGGEIALYLPKLKITDVPVTDDAGSLIEVTVNFMAETDSATGESLLLATKG